MTYPIYLFHAPIGQITKQIMGDGAGRVNWWGCIVALATTLIASIVALYMDEKVKVMRCW